MENFDHDKKPIIRPTDRRFHGLPRMPTFKRSHYHSIDFREGRWIERDFTECDGPIDQTCCKKSLSKVVGAPSKLMN
jgi:hypothetical protein